MYKANPAAKNGLGAKGKKMKQMQFFKEVKNETSKVTWPTKKETMTSTIMVFIMVVLVAVFLYLADQVIAWLIHLILS